MYDSIITVNKKYDQVLCACAARTRNLPNRACRKGARSRPACDKQERAGCCDALQMYVPLEHAFVLFFVLVNSCCWAVKELLSTYEHHCSCGGGLYIRLSMCASHFPRRGRRTPACLWSHSEHTVRSVTSILHSQSVSLPRECGRAVHILIRAVHHASEGAICIMYISCFT